MSDQKHRNAYKRYWRNRRNWERRTSEAFDKSISARRAFRLMVEAEKEMQDARTR